MIEQDKLRELFSYDPDTGIVTNKVSRGSKAIAGEEAGGVNATGYRAVSVGGQTYYGHRVAWALHYGEWPDKSLVIDHINRVKTDNRIDNLRLVERLHNQWNHGQKGDRKLPVGVGWYAAGSKYRAYIMANYKNRHLGYFDTPEAAHEAYLAAKAELHKIP